MTVMLEERFRLYNVACYNFLNACSFTTVDALVGIILELCYILYISLVCFLDAYFALKRKEFILYSPILLLFILLFDIHFFVSHCSISTRLHSVPEYFNLDLT